MPTPTDESPTSAPLLEPALLRKLERASVISRRVLRGRSQGERRSPRRGTSVEFADFRSYSHGDDLRYVDWNAFARLDRLFIKLFVEEEDLYVYLLVDGSRSMDFGSPNKLRWAKQCAAALGYLALSTHDRTQLHAHAAGQAQWSRPFRGRGTAPEAFEWLQQLQPGGGTCLRDAVESFLLRAPMPGVVFLISDLFSDDWEAALGRLAAGRMDACVLQVMAPEEYQPNLRGDLRLVDSETGEAREITVSQSALRRYEAERDAFLDQVRRTCFRYGFAHLPALSSDPVEDVVLRELRRLQVVR